MSTLWAILFTGATTYQVVLFAVTQTRVIPEYQGILLFISMVAMGGAFLLIPAFIGYIAGFMIAAVVGMFLNFHRPHTFTRGTVVQLGLLYFVICVFLWIRAASLI